MVVNDNDPFDEGLAIAFKDTVHSVASELALAWPDQAKYMCVSDELAAESHVCPAFHKVMLALRPESFLDNFVTHIRIGIVVGSQRFTLPLWEEVQEHMRDCGIRIITTRGGGGLCCDDKDITEVSMWFPSAIRLAINTIDSDDRHTIVGHSGHIRHTLTEDSLTVKGKMFRQTLPMLHQTTSTVASPRSAPSSTGRWMPPSSP